MARHLVPKRLPAAPLRTVRPLMLRDVYTNPEKELVRLRRQGLVVRIAPGTYTVKPDTVAPEDNWRPPFEHAAMAYATAQYGDRVPVLYGIGAARFHHAIPRAIAVAVVAVPEQHRPVTLTDGGKVVFTTTDVDALDARLERVPIGAFLVTTPEQTLIDLVARPQLGGMPGEAGAAARALATTTDRDRVIELLAARPGTVQRGVRTLLDDARGHQ
ncbi:MAG TPA: type IV toxin-antitoxin system AbiEi family antitoxin [Armatimonadota bacterium]|nr:type IV toxin-antitoxin system AbiEi family antitoxin [Armatimonadota bacterium]